MDAAMDRIDHRDNARGLVPVAVSGRGDEAGGAAQAALHVLAKIGMVEYALERGRMQHLEQECPHAADHHRDDIGMDHADRAVRFEQGLVGRHDRRFALVAVVEDCSDLPYEQASHRLGRTGKGEGGHHAIVPYSGLPEQGVAAEENPTNRKTRAS
jgi:hypothetical protein